MVAAAGDSAGDAVADDMLSILSLRREQVLGLTIYRSIFLFDTSALPDGATIISATLSIYGHGKAITLSPPSPRI